MTVGDRPLLAPPEGEAIEGPRIPLLPVEVARTVAAERDVPGAIAERSVFRIAPRPPKLAKRGNDRLMTLLFEGRLDTRLRELIIMRIG